LGAFFASAVHEYLWRFKRLLGKLLECVDSGQVVGNAQPVRIGGLLGDNFVGVTVGLYPFFELLFGVELIYVEIFSCDGVDDELERFLCAAVLGVVNAAVAFLAGPVAIVAAGVLGLFYAEHHPLGLKLQLFAEDYAR